MIAKKEVGKAARSLPSPAAGSVMAASLLRSDPRRLGRTQKAWRVESTSGVTLVETMIVCTIAGVLAVLGIWGYNYYNQQYAFSSAVRELTHAITVARVRAMQSQTTSRLILRPSESGMDNVPTTSGITYTCNRGNWASGKNYQIGDIVQDGPYTYRCITTHSSNITTEPAAGSNWKQDWEIISDYQYNDILVDVQHCPGGTNCVEANPYNATTPVSIQFNWLGLPVDYIDHGIQVQGAQDASGPPGNNRLGYVMITVTSLGRIKHVGEQ